jgi:threonine synthase
MDIQVSSNFERLLFEVNDRDGGMTAEQLRQLRATGHLAVEADQYEEWLAPCRGAVRRPRHLGIMRACTTRPGCW